MATSISAPLEPIYPGMARNDVTGAVVAALAQKGNGPFIGVACGTKTVLIRRSIFKASLRGLRIVDAELVTADDGTVQGQYRPVQTSRVEIPREERLGDFGGLGHEYRYELSGYGEPVTYQATHAIRVYAAAKGVKATRLFLHQDPRQYSNQRILQEYKTAELRKRLPSGAKMDKWQKHIGVLERKLAKLGKVRRPDNPVITPKLEPESDGTRRHEHEWYLQKPIRRAVMALARRGKEDLSSAKLYAEIVKLITPYYNWNGDNRPECQYVLADKAVKVTKWGEITGHERDRKGLTDIWAYLARLWEFCNLRSKPLRITFRDTEEYQKSHWGPERYYYWQRARNELLEIEVMIAALRKERGKQ